MENIFSIGDRQRILTRLSRVSDGSERRWGVMNVQEMIAHCTLQLKMAVGEVSSTRQESFLLRTKLGRWIALSSRPWPRGAATPMEMDIKKNLVGLHDVALHRKELTSYITRFLEEPNLAAHPFFGRLSREQWGRLVYKHIDHHLKQFGQ